MSKSFSHIKALTFDVFGTVVDWRSSIIKELNQLGESKGINADWEKFADRWRGGYAPSMDKVRKGELPWKSIDQLHRMVLDQLLSEFQIADLSESELVRLNKAWHRLTPWPDSVEGLTRLKQKYIIATLSNGNISLLTNMAKHSGLPWDVILSSELARHYKNDKEVYITALLLLDLEPDELMMCAAHQDDLLAAKEVGFKTAYINRPFEFGSDKKNDVTDNMVFDIIADDIIDLARQLGL